VHRTKASDVLRAIQKVGVVEFVPVTLENESLTQKEKEAFEFNHVGSRLDFAVNFLSKYAPAQGGLKGMFEGTKVNISGKEIYEIAKTYYYKDTIDAAQNIEQEIVKARAHIKDLHDEEAVITPWKKLSLTLGTPRHTATTTTFFIKGTAENILSFKEGMEAAGVLCACEPASDTHIMCVFFTQEKEKVEKLLQEHSLEAVDLPMRRGTPEEEIERISRAIKNNQEEIETLENRARELAKELRELKVMNDYIFWQKTKHDLMSNTVASAQTLVFEGWCPTKYFKDVEAAIQNKTSNYALEVVVVGKEENVPVEIENKGIIKPFEAVTRLYGLPGHNDLDPTLFLAGFFFIFFGLSLTDVGYGIILAAATGAILYFYNVPKESKPLLTLLMFGGIGSIIVGLFFGGYFGVDMSLMPGWVQALQQFDPIKNPIPVFYLALLLGVVQILVGLVLKIVREAKNGQLMDGILDQGPWIALFLTLGLWGAGSFGILPTFPYVYLVYAALLSLVLTQGRKEKNIFMKGFKGVFSLYDSVAYFSDILSYSRLLALGLATSALAFAVNLIAAMVQGVPYVGWLLMAIILVIGHLFNLAVNVLGAFIHSARLQFVEFFGKFIAGSGRDFKPFRREERNVTLIE